jgi:hypothetical protein
MRSRWRFGVPVAAALLVAACTADLSGPSAALTGVIQSSDPTGPLAKIGVGEVQGLEIEALFLGVSDETEILVESPEGHAQVGSRADLETGQRIRFERGDLVFMSQPPMYLARRIWVLRE